MSAEISAGCIRLYPDGPKWHVNSAHHTWGFIDPTQDPYIDASGMLVFDLVLPDGTPNPHPVAYVGVEEDETLTARGVSGGPSSGTQEVRIRFYKDGVNMADGVPLNLNNAVHWSRVSGDTANIWFLGVHVVIPNEEN